MTTVTLLSIPSLFAFHFPSVPFQHLTLASQTETTVSIEDRGTFLFFKLQTYDTVGKVVLNTILLYTGIEYT